jgi:RNA polymerase sigma-70 factor (ECF subfamily)
VGDREAIEREIQEYLSTENYEGAATRILLGYGAELFGFLMARLRDETAAADAFSMFSEDLWRGLPGYEARSTVRVWAYTLARHAATRQQVSPHLRRERNVSLGDAHVISKLAERLRTETAPFLRTGFKTRVAELRGRLSEEDQTLLILRVDRDLDWAEAARVFLAPELSVTDAVVKAEAARLRKRFQLIKTRIRQMASEEGITGDE